MLESAALRSFTEGAPTTHYNSGETVVFEADQAANVYSLTSGLLRLSKLLPALPQRAVLIVVPDFAIATRDAYRWLDESGTLTQAAARLPRPESWQAVEQHAFNSFEPVLFAR